MTDLARYEISLTGSALVGPGVSVFYAPVDQAGVTAALRQFYTSIADELGMGLTVSYPSGGDIISDATGAIVGAWTGTALSPTGGNISDAPVMGVGARVEWLTSGVHAGRRVRGRTFLVPLAKSRFEGPGMLTSGCVNTLKAAADALVAAVDLRIWSRPSATAPGSGTSTIVTSALVPDQVSWLRSRRT